MRNWPFGLAISSATLGQGQAFVAQSLGQGTRLGQCIIVELQLLQVLPPLFAELQREEHHHVRRHPPQLRHEPTKRTRHPVVQKSALQPGIRPRAAAPYGLSLSDRRVGRFDQSRSRTMGGICTAAKAAPSLISVKLFLKLDGCCTKVLETGSR